MPKEKEKIMDAQANVRDLRRCYRIMAEVQLVLEERELREQNRVPHMSFTLDSALDRMCEVLESMEKDLVFTDAL